MRVTSSISISRRFWIEREKPLDMGHVRHIYTPRISVRSSISALSARYKHQTYIFERAGDQGPGDCLDHLSPSRGGIKSEVGDLKLICYLRKAVVGRMAQTFSFFNIREIRMIEPAAFLRCVSSTVWGKRGLRIHEFVMAFVC